MITLSNITKNHKVGIFAIFIASALMLGTVSVSGFDSAFAGDSKDKDKHESKYKESNSYKNKNNDNEAEQEIEQTQVSQQDSQCVSGVNTTESCNNISMQLNNNTGNQALGQQ